MSKSPSPLRRAGAPAERPESARPRTASPRAIAAVAAAFVAVFVALEIGAYTRKSATWDEPVHVADGYATLARGDYRIDPEHPPLMRLWAALPLLWMGPPALDTGQVDRTPPNQWARIPYGLSQQFLYRDNDGDRLLYAARLMSVFIGAALGLLVFAWALEWLGFAGAVGALALYALEPNLAAHASLVTTDIGAACFIFGTSYFLWRTWRRPSRWNVAGLAASLVLAVVSKFSALVLGPIVVVLLLLATRLEPRLPMRMAVGLIVLLAAASYLGIWASYRFRYEPSDVAGWRFDLQHDARIRELAPGLAGAIGWIDDRHLVPNVFSEGLLLGQAKTGIRSNFLDGRISATGWWYYFPVAILIKTPISLLALTAAGGGVAIWRRRELGAGTLLFIAIPAAAFLAAAMTARINIGLRHVLPVYPFAVLLAAVAVRELAARRHVMARAALATAFAAATLEYGAVYPNTLTFFNQFVGGPSQGARYLVDSNLDWGQDLKPLKTWMDAHGVSRINLAYFGTADPAYYGIDAVHLPGSQMYVRTSATPPEVPGYVAISKTIQSGVYLTAEERGFLDGLRSLTPVADVGNSILVYHVDRPWW